jgi:metallo-beta-lactamase family protein
MEITFLGAATTVTGSQFLLETAQARILVDCGMFQGGPNEAVRNRVPLGYDPAELDAILLTHAHLDHCGLIPVVVRDGFRGPIRATTGTIELARLVLMDSGRLQEEFAKRDARWERRNPEKAAREDARDLASFERAVGEAEAGKAIDDEAAAPGPTGASPAEAAPAAGVPGVADAGAGASRAGASRTEAGDGTWDRRALPGGLRVLPGGLLADGSRVDPEADLRSQPADMHVDLDEPLYTEDDAVAALRRFRAIGYDAEEEVAPGIHATFLDAGHILGSAIVRLRVADAPGGPDTVVVFSGDLGKRNTPIIRDPTRVADADYLLVESTYGGKEHEPEAEARRVLVEVVRLVAEHQGVLLVPSFAIGRTQELIWALDRLVSSGEIPQLPLYLDSPMAREATSIYREHAEYYDEETRRLLEAGDTPLDYPNQRIVKTVEESRAIAHAPRPYMIIASNGMLTGGRVLGHLRELVDDPRAVLLFVGYQGEGTLGRHLQDGAKTIRLDGAVREVRCQVRSVSGFSAHADEPEILDWLSGFAAGKRAGAPGFPRRVFLVHGDPGPQAALAPKVAALGFDVHVPHWHESVTLD